MLRHRGSKTAPGVKRTPCSLNTSLASLLHWSNELQATCATVTYLCVPEWRKHARAHGHMQTNTYAHTHIVCGTFNAKIHLQPSCHVVHNGALTCGLQTLQCKESHARTQIFYQIWYQSG